MIRTPNTLAVTAFVIVLLLALLLPMAQEQEWFDGHGFGTILAQQLFWRADRLAGSPHGPAAERIVSLVQISLAGLLFAIILSFAVVATRSVGGRTRQAVIAAVSLAYLCFLFVFPQATFGP